jgi:hypothetical protein
MSGQAAPEFLGKTGVFHRVCARSFASVHGVSVVNLWSVLGRCDHWRSGDALMMPMSTARHTPPIGALIHVSLASRPLPSRHGVQSDRWRTNGFALQKRRVLGPDFAQMAFRGGLAQAREINGLIDGGTPIPSHAILMLSVASVPPKNTTRRRSGAFDFLTCSSMVPIVGGNSIPTQAQPSPHHDCK